MSIRKLESLNRCVIPQHLRKQLKVQEDDYMMVSLATNELVAYKYTDNIGGTKKARKSTLCRRKQRSSKDFPYVPARRQSSSDKSVFGRT